MEWPRKEEVSTTPPEDTPPEDGASPSDNPSAPDPEIAIDPGAVFPLGEVPSGSLVTINEVNYTVVGPSGTHPGQIKVRGASRVPAYFAEDIETLVLQLA